MLWTRALNDLKCFQARERFTDFEVLRFAETLIVAGQVNYNPSMQREKKTSLARWIY
jgi:hypothetical protein